MVRYLDPFGPIFSSGLFSTGPGPIYEGFRKNPEISSSKSSQEDRFGPIFGPFGPIVSAGRYSRGPGPTYEGFRKKSDKTGVNWRKSYSRRPRYA